MYRFALFVAFLLCCSSLVAGTAVLSAVCGACNPKTTSYNAVLYPIKCGDSTCCYTNPTTQDQKWVGLDCGGTCYNQSAQFCCGASGRACDKGMSCCGNECYNANTTKCCSNTAVCGSGYSCCGSSCYSPNQATCCGTTLCNIGTTCCGNVCLTSNGGGTSGGVCCANRETGATGSFCYVYSKNANGVWQWTYDQKTCYATCPTGTRNATLQTTSPSTCSAGQCSCLCPDETTSRCVTQGISGCSAASCVNICPITRPAACASNSTLTCNQGFTCGKCGQTEKCLTGASPATTNAGCPA